MSVKQFSTFNFRNLKHEKIELHSDLNFIIGDNGSGKSSILEALFYLGHGKSFRTNKNESLIANGFDLFAINVKTNTQRSLGVDRTIKNESTIKIDGVKETKLSELAKNIAIQIVTPESFKLFFGGPKERRRFVDLGLFHVKHQFPTLWKDFNRIHKQRNACLRNKIRNEQSLYWSEQFCLASEKIAGVRAEYIAELTAELSFWINILLPDSSDSIEIRYLQGWNSTKELNELLFENMEREYERGHSLYGAHKFDVKFLLGKFSLENTLSRGQQKLFLLALTFAQAKLIEKVKRVKPIILIDDIGAELDINSRKALANAYLHFNCQTIITAIDRFALEPLVPDDNNYKMFHVEHGQISVMSK